MQVKAPPQIDVYRLQDREAKLTDFLRGELDAVAGTTTRALLIVARSGDSPIARAALALSDRIATLGLAVRIVFATDDATIEPFVDRAARPSLVRELRVIRNSRLLDAHEQIVIEGRSVWFGDSLRRDPCKRDAFETYVPAGSPEVCSATSAFERLWLATACLFQPDPAPALVDDVDDVLADGPTIATFNASPIRH